MAKISTISPEHTSEIDDPKPISDNNSQPEPPVMPPVMTVMSADTPFLASESQADISLEQREKATRRGRPAGSGAPPGSAPAPNSSNTNQIRVPDPKYKTYYSDSENPNQKSKAFWNWWNQLPTSFKERCVAYVYRDWPVLITLDRDSDELTSIDCISGVEPIQNDNDLNDKYGAGDFCIWFNEALLPGRRTLCKIYVKGSRDLKSRPPSDRRINDVNQIEMTDPQNAGYIAFLRGRGLLPDQITLAKKEGELASLQAAKEMSTTVERLTDKVIKMAEDKGKGTPGSDETLRVLTQASINANEIQADAAKRSNEMLHETIRSMRELEGGAGKNGGMTFAEALELAEKLANRSGGVDPEVIQLRAEIERMRNDRMQSLEAQINALKVLPTTNSSPSATMKESITAFKEMRDLVEDVVGGGKANPVAEVGDELGLPKWAQYAIQFGLPLAGNIVSMVMAGRGLTPIPSPPMPGMPGMAGAPGTGMPMQPPPQQRPQQQQPPQSQTNPAGLPAPIPTTLNPEDRTPNGLPTFGLHPDIAELLWEVKTPMTQYITSGDFNGEDYAATFCDNYGVDTYNMLKGFGAEAVEMAILAFPPITTRLNALSVSTDKLKKFVGEFCTAELTQDGEGDDNNNKGDSDGKPAA